MKKTYTVTELAREVGLSPSTVRKMLQDRRIPEPERDWRGYRAFNERDVQRLREIVSTTTPRPPFRSPEPANARPQ
ncbi:MerR family transcriptional regulator [bacterium]|nr:MerR family transcriptional regulator [bacterium]